jgi:uncharacterized membrane protein YheB (UPF0754 family)
MLKYLLVSIISLIIGFCIARSCEQTKIEKIVVNHAITDTLIKKVIVMQEAKEVIKLVPYTVLKKQVDTLHTIDTNAQALVYNLLREVNKRDSIIVIDSLQVQALNDLAEIQNKQIDTLQDKLSEASQINETLITESNKPKKALKYSIIANFVLFIGLLIK